MVFWNQGRKLSYAAARNDSRVKSFFSPNTRSAWTPRADSNRFVSTYTGNISFFGLLGPAADHGQLLELYSQPLSGFFNCGVSSTACNPCHSVAGSLPSTGLVQSKCVSRLGMKLPWK